VRCTLAALALPLLGLLGWALSATLHAAVPPGGPAYSVAAIDDHLLHEPAAWVGRTVRVRAIFGACDTWLGPAYSSPCVSWQGAGLVDPGPAAQYLSLTPGDPPPVLAFFRRLPLLGRLAPAPQSPAWGGIAIYRVWLQPVPCTPRGPRCYQGVLADAAPGAL
jgi:hypothetical protein